MTWLLLLHWSVRRLVGVDYVSISSSRAIPYGSSTSCGHHCDDRQLRSPVRIITCGLSLCRLSVKFSNCSLFWLGLQEKIEHYLDLKRELKKIWNCSHVEIIPIVVDALGIVSKNLESWMKKINLKGSSAQLEKATLLSTARILRKILET